MAGDDYTSVTNSVLTFTPGGTTVQHITVNITDDNLIEGTERFTASLSTTNSFTKIGSINETTVRIIDDDGKESRNVKLDYLYRNTYTISG